MSREELTPPVAAAATSQVKLCPYNEEEPHIWFRLIEAQFPVAGIKSQKLKYANALARLPKQVLHHWLSGKKLVQAGGYSMFKPCTLGSACTTLHPQRPPVAEP